MNEGHLVEYRKAVELECTVDTSNGFAEILLALVDRDCKEGSSAGVIAEHLQRPKPYLETEKRTRILSATRLWTRTCSDRERFIISGGHYTTHELDPLQILDKTGNIIMTCKLKIRKLKIGISRIALYAAIGTKNQVSEGEWLQIPSDCITNLSHFWSLSLISATNGCT